MFPKLLISWKHYKHTVWQHLEECHIEEYRQAKGSGSERISKNNSK